MLMNRNSMKIWVFKVIVDLGVLVILVIFGVNNNNKEDSRIFLMILRIFSLLVDKKEIQIDLKEDKILYLIQRFHFQSLFLVYKRISILKLKINVRLVKELNVDLVLNLKNVPLVRVEELLILDKDQCKYKWAAAPVEEKEWSIKVLVIIVEGVVWLIEHRLSRSTYQRVLIQIKVSEQLEKVIKVRMEVKKEILLLS